MTAKVISGGELYHLRTAFDFQSAATYIRGRWPGAGVSFGVFDGGGMTPDLLTTTLDSAMQAADSVVWFYPELASYLTSTPPTDWTAAIQRTFAHKDLILHPHPGQSPTATPDHLAAHASVLGLLPFEGVTVYLRDKSMSINATASINSSTPISYDALMSILAPIRGIDLGNLKRNYAFVLGGNPPDAFADEWAIVSANWMHLAQACKDSGLKGIFFDNEQYSSAWGTSGGTNYTGKASIMRHNGEGIMRTCLAAFPDIEIIHAHGPYVSDAAALTILGANPGWAAANDLLGPFFEGMMDAIPAPVPDPPPIPDVPPDDSILNALLKIDANLTRLNDTIEGALKRLGGP